MLLPVFQDLIKPQWSSVLEALKQSGGMPASDLARRLGGSYMAAKSHCEELTHAGYVVRTRLPRMQVGRPEIIYSLAQKSQALFPEAGVEFTLGLLEDVKRMFGESAPEKLLFQHFQKKQAAWTQALEGLETPTQRVAKLAKLRGNDGHASTLEANKGAPTRLVELHNPLRRVFAHYPRAETIELRMLEDLLGCRLQRRERPTGRETAPHVVFELSSTATERPC